MGEIFAGSLCIELQKTAGRRGAVFKELDTLAAEFNLPVVATDSIFYLSREQEKIQRALAAIRTNRPINKVPPEQLAQQDSYFSSQLEMENYFHEYPDALQTTAEIAERCRFEPAFGIHHFPELEEDAPPLDILQRKALAGAVQRYGQITPEIRQRIMHELGIIEESGFASIFLIMEDILQFCERADIPVSSRGSAGGSLVAHCLGITTPDPLRLKPVL